MKLYYYMVSAHHFTKPPGHPPSPWRHYPRHGLLRFAVSSPPLFWALATSLHMKTPGLSHSKVYVNQRHDHMGCYIDLALVHMGCFNLAYDRLLWIGKSASTFWRHDSSHVSVSLNLLCWVFGLRCAHMVHHMNKRLGDVEEAQSI